MPTSIVKWENPQKNTNEPTHYLGVIVPCSRFITGKINLNFLLRDFSETSITTADDKDSLSVIAKLVNFGNQMQFKDTFEVHLIECNASEIPNAEHMQQFLKKVMEQYKVSLPNPVNIISHSFKSPNHPTASSVPARTPAPQPAVPEEQQSSYFYRMCHIL